MSTNQERYTANPNFVLRTIAGEHVLISVGDGIASFCGLIKLNATAKFMWELLNTGTTKAELIQAFCKRFGIDEDVAAKDVDRTLDMLQKKELVRVG